MPKQIAQAFCKQFTTPPDLEAIQRLKRPSRRLRRTTRNIPIDHTLLLFTPEMVAEAIRGSGTSTACGPDGLNILHLRNLGDSGITFLCTLYNLSLSRCDIPACWKLAIIVAILKAGKPASLGSSYRPISLLSPAAKVLERLLLPHITTAFPLSPSQHGFRPRRSTTTALLPLSHAVATGFNRRKPPSRSIALAIDFSKAFDSIPHNLLISRITQSTLHPNIKRWLSAYLRGRAAACLYQRARSRFRSIRAGVPQGSVISPSLFNAFVEDYPVSADLHTSYADDFTALTASPRIPEAAERLTRHAGEVNSWAKDHGLQISLPKSNVTLFTSDSHQSNLDPMVSLGGEKLPLCRQPRILGVTFDTHFTFARHIKLITDAARGRLNVMKALAGTSWGHSKETLLTTFRAIIKPLFSYAAPVWFPNASESAISNLQTVQNAALRVATGAIKMSAEDHLHAETRVLKVKDSLSLICSQFLASALRPDHPSHASVTMDSGPRRIRHTLQSKFLPVVSPYLSEEGSLPPEDYGATLKELHSNAVEAAVANSRPNRVLGVPPPDINPEEISLPRASRTALSQLRSGFSSSLQDYLYRIGRSQSPACPECGADSQSVAHLFVCPAFPTDLSPVDLWVRPCRVADFLSLLPFFSHLSRPPEPGP